MSHAAPRLALLAVLCLSSTAALADSTAPAAMTAPASVTTATPPAASAMLTLAQADAVIMQNGFTPVGQPILKGTVIGSLARLGNKAFIVTVDAVTGKFLDAKPADVTLPPLAAITTPVAPAAIAAPAAAPTASVATPTPPPVVAFSPVKVAADLARSKGFKVLSFKHASDDTFLVAQRGNALFALKIDDKGRLVSITPLRQGDNSDND